MFLSFPLRLSSCLTVGVVAFAFHTFWLLEGSLKPMRVLDLWGLSRAADHHACLCADTATGSVNALLAPRHTVLTTMRCCSHLVPEPMARHTLAHAHSLDQQLPFRPCMHVPFQPTDIQSHGTESDSKVGLPSGSEYFGAVGPRFLNQVPRLPLQAWPTKRGTNLSLHPGNPKPYILG